jgi:hypothetical protein
MSEQLREEIQLLRLQIEQMTAWNQCSYMQLQQRSQEMAAELEALRYELDTMRRQQVMHMPIGPLPMPTTWAPGASFPFGTIVAQAQKGGA